MFINMSYQDNVSQPIINNQTSPKPKRNTKNLSLQLKNSNHINTTTVTTPNIPIRSLTNSTSPTPQPIRSPNVISPTEMSLYRHPSLNRANFGSQPHSTLKRRTTLSLSIPDHATKTTDITSNNIVTNSIKIPSCPSSTSSSPLIPSTPKEHLMSFTESSTTINTNIPAIEASAARKETATATAKTRTISLEDKSDTPHTQTLVQDLSNMTISADNEIYNLHCYPDGPVCVKSPNLYLYSEPTCEELKKFDLVVNVAKECLPPFPYEETLPTTGLLNLHYENTQYYYVPWTHTSKLCRDLKELTDVIVEYLRNTEMKILIHCQCGVSRSASLIIALFMKLNHENLNESYSLLKMSADKISPNMSLIFQLMEWGEMLGVNGPVYTPTNEEPNIVN